MSDTFRTSFSWTNQPPLEDVMREWWNRSSEEDRINALQFSADPARLASRVRT